MKIVGKTKTKRLRDYLPPSLQPHEPPSFNDRPTRWVSQQIQSLYDANQISVQDYFRLLGDMGSLALRTTEDIQDLLENCVAARGAGFVKENARAKGVMALHRAYPDKPIKEVFAIEEIFASVRLTAGTVYVPPPAPPRRRRFRGFAYARR